MKAMLIVASNTACKLVSFYLKPLGFELIRYRSPVKAMDNMDEADPDAVIVNAEDFPRHWKTLVQFVRAERDKKRTAVILLKGPTFAFEDAAKAVHLGVNGIVSDNLDDAEELDRLQSILERYKPVRNGRKARRVRPANWDKLDFMLSRPDTGAIITGRITSISETGLAFLPDAPESLADIPIGTAFPECSLRVDAAILSPSCNLVRSGPDIAFTFTRFSGAEREKLETYLVERPLRRLRAAE